jgi:hypothetical protein
VRDKVEKINARNSACTDKKDDDSNYPRRPNEILSKVTLTAFRIFAANKRQAFLQTADWAEITARRPANKKRQSKLKDEHNEAGIDDALSCAHNYYVGRKIEYDYRKKKKCPENDCFS